MKIPDSVLHYRKKQRIVHRQEASNINCITGPLFCLSSYNYGSKSLLNERFPWVHVNNMRYLTLQSVVLGRKKVVHPHRFGSRGSNWEGGYQVIPSALIFALRFFRDKKHGKVNKVVTLLGYA